MTNKQPLISVTKSLMNVLSTTAIGLSLAGLALCARAQQGEYVGDYLPLSIGKLANIDPALIVKPPVALEIGYVPIVARQGLEKDPPALSTVVAATDPAIRYVGRFDLRDTAGPRCSWSASTVTIRFNGEALNAVINEQGDNRWQVEVDGKAASILSPQKGEHRYTVADKLNPGEHTVSLVKATEGFVGVTQFVRFELSGKLLKELPLKRRIEVIGDSISCGYGNEGANQNEHFTPKTENAYYTYGAIAARSLHAAYDCVAFSGRKMWPDNTMGELYDRSLTFDPNSGWDYSRWTPDAILINLATNDFGKAAPDKDGWIGAYEAFINRLRTHYPSAMIYCAAGPMMTDESPTNKPLTVLREYLAQIQRDLTAAGDKRIRIIDFPTQDPQNGLGSDWHPNIKTHELMAKQLVEALHKDLDW